MFFEHMSRSSRFPALVAALVIGFWPLAPAGSAVQQPNILLIVSEDNGPELRF
ncbi:hypothetical protein MYX75_02200 [Acidobacteria bacterium AH-259-A15]|nr:hypothetical protein [Acidobacteria bacterium AH-259-A15]